MFLPFGTYGISDIVNAECHVTSLWCHDLLHKLQLKRLCAQYTLNIMQYMAELAFMNNQYVIWLACRHCVVLYVIHILCV